MKPLVTPFSIYCYLVVVIPCRVLKHTQECAKVTLDYVAPVCHVLLMGGVDLADSCWYPILFIA